MAAVSAAHRQLGRKLYGPSSLRSLDIWTMASLGWLGAIGGVGFAAVSVIRRWRMTAPSKGNKVF
jgi:hypothetical protein